MKPRMTGSYPLNLHEGSRSELLADYAFTAWGTVTPVRWQDDHGLDLYCTLREKIGQRGLVRDYFVVQVKSDLSPWTFNHPESVRWLVEYPTPLFLACVDKKEGVVRVYHVLPRFYAWAMGKLPDSLELIPEDIENGTFIEWDSGDKFALSAPVIRVTLRDMIDDKRMQELGEVFAHWVRVDRENSDRVRYGLLRFRMPFSYTVNKTPEESFGQIDLTVPDQELLDSGLKTLAESAECIGGQLGGRKDLLGALWAALLVDHLRVNYANAFSSDLAWRQRVPGSLGSLVCPRLNDAAGCEEGSYLYRGLETVRKLVTENTLIKRFLEGEGQG